MIIGLTGSFGAGKGCAADYLVNQKGFAHYSAREFIQEEVIRRGLDISLGREVTIPIANELRKKYGPSYIMEQLMLRALSHGGNAVVESLRAVAEVKYIQQHGGVVLGIDADPHVRYERAIKRGSETDHVTFEEWCAQEVRESNPDDPTKQDIFGALRESNHIIMNTNSLEELYQAIDSFVAQYGN
jgi:dephospho-CoA kinase